MEKIPNTARCDLCKEDFEKDNNACLVREVLPNGEHGPDVWLHTKCIEELENATVN
jgi:hypothetical protein